jgi:hypothetical protein
VLPEDNRKNQGSYNVDYVNLRYYLLDLTIGSRSKVGVGGIVMVQREMEISVYGVSELGTEPGIIQPTAKSSDT